MHKTNFKHNFMYNIHAAKQRTNGLVEQKRFESERLRLRCEYFYLVDIRRLEVYPPHIRPMPDLWLNEISEKRPCQG